MHLSNQLILNLQEYISGVSIRVHYTSSHHQLYIRAFVATPTHKSSKLISLPLLPH